MSNWIKFKQQIKWVIGFEKKPKSYKYPYFIEYRKDKIKFEVNNHTERFRLLDFGGEEEFVRSLASSLRSSDVFFDIGASVGLVSVFAGKKLQRIIMKSGRVFSFEPDPQNALRLSRNIEINKLRNCQILQMAISDNEGELSLFSEGSDANSPSLQKVNGIDRSIKVPTNSIDNLIKLKRIPYPDIVKIDIEGAEVLALKGMKDLLKSNNRPRLLFVEIHPDFLTSFDSDSNSVISFVESFGYVIKHSVERENQILCTFSV